MTTDVEELYSLLVPLSEDRLIVPRSCVVEVVRFSQPNQEAGAPRWMLGKVNWNCRELPLVSFEGAIGKDVQTLPAEHELSCSMPAAGS